MLNVKKLLNIILRNVEIRELLWTNPNPNSAFSAQTLTFNGEYDEYEIIVSHYLSLTDYQYNKVIANGHVALITSVGAYSSEVGGALRFARRRVTPSANEIVFTTGYASGSTYEAAMVQSNDSCLPQKIYGIKKLGDFIT